MHWEIRPTRVPFTLREWEATVPDDWDVTLTEAGRSKLESSKAEEPARLKPGLHYTIRLTEGTDCILFPPHAATATLRHNWYLTRRFRPRCPHFGRAPVPQGFAENVEQNAKLTSVYFRAWTLNASAATFSVPFLGNLLGEHSAWEDSLRAWLQRLPSKETKQYVGNFLSVYRVRPAAEVDSNSDDDNMDTKFDLRHHHLGIALRTQLPAQKRAATKTWNDDRATDAEAAFARAEKFWTWPRNKHNVQDDGTTFCDVTPATILKAARKKPTSVVPSNTSVPSAMATTDVPDYVRQVKLWKATLSDQGICNAEQVQFCHLVADRVVQELIEGNNGNGKTAVDTEPLRWVLHGGPGTGKSYTLRLLREHLFERTMGWKHGVHFQIVSFQAVMAELLSGDTIHHALGLEQGLRLQYITFVGPGTSCSAVALADLRRIQYGQRGTPGSIGTALPRIDTGFGNFKVQAAGRRNSTLWRIEYHSSWRPIPASAAKGHLPRRCSLGPSRRAQSIKASHRSSRPSSAMGWAGHRNARCN